MEPIVGTGKYTYRVNEEWQQPTEWLNIPPVPSAAISFVGPPWTPSTIRGRYEREVRAPPMDGGGTRLWGR